MGLVDVCLHSSDWCALERRPMLGFARSGVMLKVIAFLARALLDTWPATSGYNAHDPSVV